MSDFGYSTGATLFKTYGGVAASSLGTTITAPGSVNTKGAWAQIVASTDFPAVGIIVALQIEPGSGDTQQLIDVGVGAAASEVVIVPNLLTNRCTSAEGAKWKVYIPVAIPAGTRVAMRYQSNGTAPVIYATVAIVGGQAKRQILSPGKCTDYGSATGTSVGQTVDPGGTINTEGAYTQIVASTTYAIRGLIVCLGNLTTGAGNPRWLADLAVGAGGSEQIVIADLMHSNPGPAGGGGHASDNGWHYLPMAIPAGTRIAMRAQCSINTASDRNLTCNVIGVS